MRRRETGRLLLEAWDERFLEDYVRLQADPQMIQHVGDGVPRDRRGSVERFRRHLHAWATNGFGPRWLIEKATGRGVGYVSLAYTGWEAIEVPSGQLEIGWFVLPYARGRGLATEAAADMLDEAFETLPAERIIARTQPRNTASNGVARRIGMRLARRTRGRHGEEVWVYELTRDAWLLARASRGPND